MPGFTRQQLLTHAVKQQVVPSRVGLPPSGPPVAPSGPPGGVAATSYIISDTTLTAGVNFVGSVTVNGVTVKLPAIPTADQTIWLESGGSGVTFTVDGNGNMMIGQSTMSIGPFDIIRLRWAALESQWIAV